jgi:uncharacterized protein (TIGR02300 family)
LAHPELGAKQICPTCQSKFYDLTKRPAHCPKCGTDFDPEEEALRSRRTRTRGGVPDYDKDDAEEKVKEADAEDVDGLEEEPDNTPELDEGADADAVESDDADEDPGVPTPSEPDLGVGIEEETLEDDDGDDVPFLEDEDEDDFPDDDIEGMPGEEEEH